MADLGRMGTPPVIVALPASKGSVVVHSDWALEYGDHRCTPANAIGGARMDARRNGDLRDSNKRRTESMAALGNHEWRAVEEGGNGEASMAIPIP
ncbi:hypothetical protein NMY22_g6462 [Coprinellus aureogranulatus]|nr:hypothetical protein NMY22_g6462 [Coprinellus aureogranulatus]